MSHGKLNYLNLGCGQKFHPDWVNADLHPLNKEVLACNFINGIPFEDERFQVVYHSHVLEHFPKADGEYFIAECYRILRKGGIIRMAMPDLERMAREYLKNLEAAFNGDEDAANRYNWIMLELYDQAVRVKTGGDMQNFLSALNATTLPYVDHRIGVKSFANDVEYFKTQNQVGSAKASLKDRVAYKFGKLRQLWPAMMLSKEDRKALEIGHFRLSGEVHQWMYDRFSLKRLLEKVGFQDIQIRTSQQSYIENWSSFRLDNPNETSSIFIEGIRR